MTVAVEPRYAEHLERYRQGVWRDRILHDLILDDARQLGDGLTFLDIGCGQGLDGDVPLQRSLAENAARYVGVEPDTTVTPGDYVTEVHRCLFEDMVLPPGSVHVAFAVMVLEHLREPQRFWDKLHEVLADGGVFWGLTVDARHWFCRASLLAERMNIKELYLNGLLGRRGTEKRYENYPTFYRCNRPDEVRRFAAKFRSCEAINFSRVGQVDSYLPRFLGPLTRAMDRRAIRRGRPGTLLAVRAVK